MGGRAKKEGETQSIVEKGKEVSKDNIDNNVHCSERSGLTFSRTCDILVGHYECSIVSHIFVSL